MRNARQKRLIRIAPREMGDAVTREMVGSTARWLHRKIAEGNVQFVISAVMTLDGKVCIDGGGSSSELSRRGLADMIAERLRSGFAAAGK